MSAVSSLPDTGEFDDIVRIRLGSDFIQTVENYNFHSAILQQPAAFTIRLSGAKGAAEVLAKYKPGPGSPTQLLIGSNPQLTGELDGADADGSPTSTTVELRGRDLLARLFDTDIPGERTFSNASYEELFKAAIADVGLSNKLTFVTNAAARRIRSGSTVKIMSEPVTTDEVKQTATGEGFRNTVIAKMGESWLTFLERHFSKQGLFCWTDTDGNFVLSRPNGDQPATFHFYRARGKGSSTANVTGFRFTNDTVKRFSEVTIFARNGGRKQGHNHTNGGFVDQEMVNLGFKRRKVYRDVEVVNAREAEFFARKKIAEANRASWKLQYTISGHSAPIVDGGRRDRAIIVPDMVARVDDDELDIHQNLYIESVEYKSPPRTTVITMMRPQDLLFGEAQAAAAKKMIKPPPPKIRQPISFKRDPRENEFTNAYLAYFTRKIQ